MVTLLLKIGSSGVHLPGCDHERVALAFKGYRSSADSIERKEQQ